MTAVAERTAVAVQENRRAGELVVFEHVDLGYGARRVLVDMNLTLSAGDHLAIVGPNGSGKTTLLKGLLGLIKPMGGHIRRKADLRFGYVPQRQFVDEVFTAAEIALMGRYPLMGVFSRPSQRDRDLVIEALAHVGIVDLADKSYRELSGGQKQRVLIARALAAQTDVLVLDEPTNDMDIASEHSIMELVKHLCEADGITVVMVSHLLNVVANYAESLVIIDGGVQAAGPVAEVLTSAKLSEIYGVPVAVDVCAGRRVVVTGGSNE
jgi:ABC-type cobalamin/Fe3+-siderophores transport system ATPase subunit